MSAFPSAYIQDKILESIFKNVAFTPPASLYVALYTTNPNADNSGTEVTGGSYARKVVTFAASSSGSIPSNAALAFTSLPTAVITHYGVLDAATAGNLITYGALPSPISANSGDEVTVASGSITFTFSGS